MNFFTGSLRNKLFAVVAVLAAVILCVGSIGLFKLNAMYDRLDTMVNGNVEKVKLGARIKQDLLAVSVSKMIGTIAASAEEQSAASTQISQNIQSIKSVADQNAQAVTQSAAAATELSQKAENLQAMVAEFKTRQAA